MITNYNREEAFFTHSLLKKFLVPLITTLIVFHLSPSTNKVYAQTRKTVIGVITDENKEPIPGVSVLVKETKATTQTDAEGRFRVQAWSSEHIEISYLGYLSQTIQVGNGTTLNVSLKPSVTTLSNVVVVGYGTVKRSDLTGAVGSVNMTDFEKAPVKSFDQALAGRVAGVQVSMSDGQPGSVANIVIRGAGSISQDNSPLYVIDGFPSESSEANSLSPSDIESIDILKDASSTAIYGARGSNGVVLITTKRGQVGTPKISYNSFLGITKGPEQVKLLDPYEYVRLLIERDPNVLRSVNWFANGTTLEDYRNAPSINWQDQVNQTGTNQNHDLAIRGGADKTTYALSFNYNDQEGVIKYSGFNRYQGRLVLDQNISKKLKVGINTNYSYTEAIGLPVNANNFYASTGFLYSVWGFRPVVPIGDPNGIGDLLDSFEDPESDVSNQNFIVNPYLNLSNQKTKIKNLTSQTNGYAEYNITPKLKFRVSGGFTKNGIEGNVFNNSQTQAGNPRNANGINGTISNDNRFSLVNDNIITYKNSFNKKHNVTIVGGYSTQSYKTSFNSIRANQITDEALGLDALDMVPSINTIVVSRSSIWRLQSFLTRANYDYKGKYLLTASFRADGSSKFSAGNRWGYFPSASGAWRFSQESFLKGVKWLADGKLRIGYGESGNNRVSDFAYASQDNLTNLDYWYSYNGQAINPGFVITAVGNDDLKWETNTQTNIGLDLSFLKKRIEVTIDAYKRVTDDLLLNALLPYAHGIPSGLGFKNIGSLENRGLEFSLNTRNIQGKDFKWNSSFNISFNKNKILELTEGTNALTAGSGTFFDTNFSSLSPYISVKGRAVGDMYGLIFDGVYQFEDFDLLPNGSYLLKPDIARNGGSRASIRPGDIKYRDLNGDLEITADDYTIIGRGLPIHTGGFNNNFTYKNWDLNVFLQWSYGNNIINANRYTFEGAITNNYSLNQFATYAGRWTPTNPSNTLFRVGGMGSPNYSSRVVEDGSYLRLKTIQLAYNFTSNTLKKLGMGKLTLNVAAQNLLTLTNYSGLDPEASARQSNLTPGFDFGTYPQAKTITFGLNATF